MKITVVCEHDPAMDTEEGKAAYPERMCVCLNNIFGEAGESSLYEITEAGVNIPDDVLEHTDVMVWWGHIYHTSVADELVEKIANRVQRGMGMIFLHSAHNSKPFGRLLGTSCSLGWREDGDGERLWCVDPTHPIAQGLGEFIDIPHEETYSEPFDIPTPDELVYIGWFTGGNVFRGGCVFKRGRGKIFYFNPGHETFPTYKIAKVRQLLVQACKYVAPVLPVKERIECPHIQKCEF